MPTPRLALLRALLVLVPSVAVAQVPQPAAPRAHATAPDAFARVRLGERVRLTQVSTGPLEGRYIARADGSITLDARDGVRTISRSAIDSVWTWHRGTGSGAGAGALIGGLGLGLLTNAYARGMGSDGSDAAAAFGVGFAVGALGGAVLGAALGALHSGWNLRFP